MSRARAGRLVALLLAALLAACGSEPAPPARAVDIPEGQACALDGMLLGLHAGPKAQLQHADGSRAFYCDTKDVFGELLDPVRRRRVAGIWFQALDEGPWKAHPGGWAPADSVWFVAGSDRLGPMGPVLAPFRRRDAAAAFRAEHGGRLVRFDEVDAALLDRLRQQGMEGLHEAGDQAP